MKEFGPDHDKVVAKVDELVKFKVLPVHIGLGNALALVAVGWLYLYVITEEVPLKQPEPLELTSKEVVVPENQLFSGLVLKDPVLPIPFAG